jgi:ADP-L-glycero-D-manno-heptose 6-epimerase
MKIILTGQNGFIGSNFRNKILLDPKNSIITKESDLKYGALFPKADFFYHLASNTNTLEPDNYKMFENNLLSFLNVLRYCVDTQTKLIWASSSAVYGNGDGPLNAYAESKYIMERLVEYFRFKVPIVGLRFFNVYGPGEIQKGKMASMITQWAIQIKNGQRPRIFKEKPDEIVRRDHIYVKDIIKALEIAKDLEPGLYDVGSGTTATFAEVLDLVQKSLGSDKKPELIKNNNRNTYQTLTQANLNWDFKPDYSLEKGIEDYLCKYF